MADAVRLRQKAINGILRWQQKRADAEQKIEELSTQRSAAEESPVPVAVVDDGALIDEAMQPLFGVTTQ